MRFFVYLLFCCPLIAQELGVRWEPSGHAHYQGDDIQFAATVFEDTEVTYQWDFGDGSQGEGEQISHAFAEPGRYLVRTTAVFADQRPSLTRTSVIFANDRNGPPPETWGGYIAGEIAGSMNFPMVLQAGSTLSLESQSDQDGGNFFWHLTGSDTFSQGADWTWTIPQDFEPGYIAIDLFFVHPDGTANPWPDRVNLYIWQGVEPPDVTTLSPEPENDGFYHLDLGETLNLSGRAEGAEPLTMYWEIECRGELGTNYCQEYDIPESGIQEGADFSFTPDRSGYFELVVGVRDGEGRQDPFPKREAILVRGRNRAPSVYIQQPSGVWNINDNVAFSAAGSDPDGDPLTYSWTFRQGGLSLPGQTVGVIFQQAGAFQISVVAIDSAGAASEPYRIWALINDPEAAPINQSPVGTIQAPQWYESFPLSQPVQFEAYMFDRDDEAVSGYWDFGDGAIAEGASVSHQYQTEGVKTATFFVRDAKGYTAPGSDRVVFSMYEGEPPPRGEIHLPTPSAAPGTETRYYAKVGEPVTFSGGVLGVEDTQGYQARWELLTEPFPTFLDGFQPQTFTFDRAGAFYAQFKVTAPDGTVDPLPPSMLVIVRDNEPPVVHVDEPGHDLLIAAGDGIRLSARAEDPDGDALTYSWQLSDGRTFTGAQVERVLFPETGLFWLTLSVSDAAGNQVDSERRTYIIVNPTAAYDETIMPRPITATPDSNQVNGPVGSSYQFLIAEEDAHGRAVEAYHWDLGEFGTTASAQTPTILIHQPGWYDMRYFARLANGYWSTAGNIAVVIYGDNTPPQVAVSEPALREHRLDELAHTALVAQGGSLTPIGTASDPDGNLPITLVWSLDFEEVGRGQSPGPLTFPETGRYHLSLRGFDAENQSSLENDYRTVHVYDPDLKPTATIVEPDGPIEVSVGQALAFEAFGEDPNGLEMNFEWDFGIGVDAPTTTGSRIFPVVFPRVSPGDQPFEIKVWAKTAVTEQAEPTIVTVRVVAHEDGAYEPNNSFEQAADLLKGYYAGLSISDGDPADYFRFDVSQGTRDLRLRIDGDARLRAELLDETGAPLPNTLLIAEKDSLRLHNLEPGHYVLRLEPEDPAVLKRRALSYGFSVTTLKPSLYFPLMVDDGNLISYLGLLNPSDESVPLVVQGFDAAGGLRESVSMTLSPRRRLYQTSESFFSTENGVKVARGIRWVRVLSDRPLIGYCNAHTVDGSQMMSAGALTGLSASVVVPHIALDTAQWYTRAVLVNGDDSARDLSFTAPGAALSLAETDSGVQEDFRLNETFNAGPPAWGSFNDDSGSDTMAGFEIFGRNDGFPEMAALEMVDVRGSNPNHTYIRNDVYFTHVADQNLFWTGIALVNYSQAEAGYNMVAYAVDGTELDRRNGLSLQPGEKLLTTTAALFGSQPVAWIKMEADDGLTGFELFGNAEGTLLAGFPTANFLADELVFPHIDIRSGQSWTGIALVNVDAQPVTVDLAAYDADGVLLAQAQTTLAGFTKTVALPAVLFPGLDPSVAYITAKADRKVLTGFELFGALNQDGSLGETFAGLTASGR